MNNAIGDRFIPTTLRRAQKSALNRRSGPSWLEARLPFAGGWRATPPARSSSTHPGTSRASRELEPIMNETAERCFFCRTQKPTVAVKLLGLFVWICDDCHERWLLQKDR